jgi:hypothetical protein
LSDFITATISTENDIVQYLRENTKLDRKTIVRFAKKVDILPSGCWFWDGNFNTSGGLPYGRFRFEGAVRTAHRFIWEQFFGPVPEGLVLDHYLHPQDGCIGARCANPHHVAPTTQKENVLRGNGLAARNSRKTACRNGHEYNRVDTRGYRICTPCKAEYERDRILGLADKKIAIETAVASL